MLTYQLKKQVSANLQKHRLQEYKQRVEQYYEHKKEQHGMTEAEVQKTIKGKL